MVKTDTSDPEPEGLTLLVPDIQRTAEIVYAATTSLRQANQGMYNTREHIVVPLRENSQLQSKNYNYQTSKTPEQNKSII